MEGTKSDGGAFLRGIATAGGLTLPAGKRRDPGPKGAPLSPPSLPSSFVFLAAAGFDAPKSTASLMRFFAPFGPAATSLTGAACCGGGRGNGTFAAPFEVEGVDCRGSAAFEPYAGDISIARACDLTTGIAREMVGGADE